jgi:hypothetical protein
MKKTILFFTFLLTSGCDTVYHHNTVYQDDTVHDTTESGDSGEYNIEFYCDERLCNNQK